MLLRIYDDEEFPVGVQIQAYQKLNGDVLEIAVLFYRAGAQDKTGVRIAQPSWFMRPSSRSARARHKILPGVTTRH